MYTVTRPVNQPVTIYFSDVSGLTTFLSLTMIKDSVVTLIPTTVIEVQSTGVYAITFTPNITGHYVISYKGELIAAFDVVTRTIQSYLQNIEDEAIGSWSWDKQAGTLTMVRQDGSNLAVFNTQDTLSVASRERV